MHLYEINQQIRDILSQVDEDGMLPDEAYEQLGGLNQSADIKIEAIACLIKEEAQTAKMIKDEVFALTKRQKSHEKHAENLRNYLAGQMINSGKMRFESTKCELSFSKSSGVVVDDESVVPGNYYKTWREISKSTIADDLKAGIAVPGARIEERQNLRVK